MFSTIITILIINIIMSACTHSMFIWYRKGADNYKKLGENPNMFRKLMYFYVNLKLFWRIFVPNLAGLSIYWILIELLDMIIT